MDGKHWIEILREEGLLDGDKIVLPGDTDIRFDIDGSSVMGWSYRDRKKATYNDHFVMLRPKGGSSIETTVYFCWDHVSYIQVTRHSG